MSTSSSSNDATESSPLRHGSTPRWFAAILLLALAAYGLFLFDNYGAVAAGADSGGYYIEAKLMTEGRLSTPMRITPEMERSERFLYTPLGMIGNKECTVLSPTYPPGLPLHYAVFGGLGGWKRGVRVFGVLAALTAVALVYGLARKLDLSPLFATFAAGSLAISPQFLFTSIVPLSDTVATAWCTAAVLLALRGREEMRWAAAAGMAFAMAVLVRPANAILIVPLLILLWGWRGLLGAFLGGLPGAVFLAWFQWKLYGHPLKTGYGNVMDGELFQFAFVAPTLEHYAVWLPRILPASVALLLLPLLPWRERPREILALWAWLLAFAVFYAFYEFTQTTWWFLRFLLPAFPAIAVLGTWVCERAVFRFVPEALGQWRIVAAAALCTITATVCSYWTRHNHVMLMGPYQQPYRASTAWVEKNLPPEAIIATHLFSSAVFFYTPNPIVRWDIMNPEHFAKLRAGLARTGRPLYALVFPSEVAEGALSTRMPAVWEKVHEVSGVEVWKYDPEKSAARRGDLTTSP